MESGEPSGVQVPTGMRVGVLMFVAWDRDDRAVSHPSDWTAPDTVEHDSITALGNLPGNATTVRRPESHGYVVPS